MKGFKILLLLQVSICSCYAQFSSPHPYSFYGLGNQNTSNGSIGTILGGAAFQSNQYLNISNPAAAISLDKSINYIFETNASLQSTSFAQNDLIEKQSTGNLNYLVGGVRGSSKVFSTFGIVPFQSIDYTFSKTALTNGTITEKNFTGEGTINQYFYGISINPLKAINLGVKGSWYYGTYNRTETITSTELTSDLSYLKKSKYTGTGLDLGVQFQPGLFRQKITLGAVYKLRGKWSEKNTSSILYSTDSTEISVTKKQVSSGNELNLGISYNSKIWTIHSEWGYSKVDKDNSTQQSIPMYSFTLGTIRNGDTFKESWVDKVSWVAGFSLRNYKYKPTSGLYLISSFTAGAYIPFAGGWSTLGLLYTRESGNDTTTTADIKSTTDRISLTFTFRERWYKRKID